MNIKPGDEVVCIDDTTLPEQYLGIRAGETYTATWVGLCRTYLGGDYAGSVAAYDAIHDHILVMADTLSAGIMAQFPHRFR